MRSLLALLLLAPLAVLTAADKPKAAPQAPKKQARPTPPTRAFDAPGAPAFVKLGDKTSLADGNYLVGPTYVAAPETKAVEGVPQGKIQQFQIDSKTTQRFNPGIAREEFGIPDPNNPKTLIVKTHNIDYKRTITVYVPAQYVPGTAAPLLVTHDGPGLGKPDLNTARILDNLIAQKRIPALIMVQIANGGGDAQGHERGKEYDNMSGLYAEYIQHEVLPLVEKNYGVKLTADPEGRATMGTSSGGSAALIMAWYHPEWFRRVLTLSGTFVNQQFRIQKFAQAVPGPVGATDDLVVLAQLVAAVTGTKIPAESNALWPVLATEVPALGSVRFADLPETGLLLDGAPWSALPFAEGETLHYKPATGPAAATPNS